jgi:hypothetical protein
MEGCGEIVQFWKLKLIISELPSGNLSAGECVVYTKPSNLPLYLPAAACWEEAMRRMFN